MRCASASAWLRWISASRPSAGQEDLLSAIGQLNADPAVDGFLVQNPVPPGYDYAEALARVSPAKDVDGLHPVNLGYLALGEPGHPRPCTPLGIRAMLAYYEVPVEGRSVVVVGRGPTLGRPLALLLSLKEPGPTPPSPSCIRGSRTGPSTRGAADIVVGAAGVPNMITPDVVAPGSCVIGGGMTWEGRKALSDVDERCARGGGLGHPSPRWCGRDDGGHAPSQHRGGGGGVARPCPLGP